jgi:hypothetical protein
MAERGWAVRGHASNLWLPEGGREDSKQPRSAGEVARNARERLVLVILRMSVDILLGVEGRGSLLLP